MVVGGYVVVNLSVSGVRCGRWGYVIFLGVCCGSWGYVVVGWGYVVVKCQKLTAMPVCLF